MECYEAIRCPTLPTETRMVLPMRIEGVLDVVYGMPVRCVESLKGNGLLKKFAGVVG